MSKDLTKRAKNKAGIKVTTITRSSLRGDMQDRLHRQEILRVGDIIKKNKKEKLLKAEREIGFDNFDEPIFRRIRRRGGFS